MKIATKSNPVRDGFVMGFPITQTGRDSECPSCDACRQGSTGWVCMSHLPFRKDMPCEGKPHYTLPMLVKL